MPKRHKARAAKRSAAKRPPAKRSIAKRSASRRPAAKRAATSARRRHSPAPSALPGRRDCCWSATAPQTNYPALEGSGGADVAIVGAGIVGLTAAYLLARAGLSVAVLEARRIGRQVTGRSTAKITTQHGLIYRHLIDTFGIDHAQRYAEANRRGAEQIADWIDQLGIACDLERKDAYAYTCSRAQRQDVEAEAEAARQVGFDCALLDRAPLPFDTAAALRFPDQAQFNPAKYLVGLALAVEVAGGRIFENSRVVSVEAGDQWRVTGESGLIEARHVALATNLPIAGDVQYDSRAQPRYHIAMAFRAPHDRVVDGMFIGVDEPTHSLRMGRDDEGPLLIALGPRFNTGQDGDVAQRFRGLERWVRERFEVGTAAWRWANEDYDTADRVPFAGAPSEKEPGLYVATGFNAWGISNGTAAGILISDGIRGRSNPWRQLYDPRRPSPKDFVQAGKTQSAVSHIDDIAASEGGVLTVGKEKIAVWKDDTGKSHAMSASCTHKGCVVTWNNAERTWDCPCHGSIFQANGRVVHGPAVEPLRPAELPASRRGTSARKR
jgi:glycine/D-amino acid oxidase-like deaminating enzyme/nitrite reductase/ring-hydroxylating ferredoxin subunit